VWGGVGNDSLDAGEGNDIVRGRPGDDTVQGGAGNDRIWPGRGADVENGGPGDDVLHALANDDLVDRIDCGEGNDIVWLNVNEQDVHVNCETVRMKAARGDGGDN
jgi:Ca2+-binding RTX toxin-like protein